MGGARQIRVVRRLSGHTKNACGLSPHSRNTVICLPGYIFYPSNRIWSRWFSQRGAVGHVDQRIKEDKLKQEIPCLVTGVGQAGPELGRRAQSEYSRLWVCGLLNH